MLKMSLNDAYSHALTSSVIYYSTHALLNKVRPFMLYYMTLLLWFIGLTTTLSQRCLKCLGNEILPRRFIVSV